MSQFPGRHLYLRSHRSRSAFQVEFIYLFISDQLFQQQLSSTFISPIDRCRQHTCSGEREEAVMEGGEEPELTSVARVSTGH